ncbi:MAG: ORF6N domain-containing protein [Cytophagales bacterium]|nr:ORF6N domain-containing protein [Cytophagales bacterium]
MATNNTLPATATATPLSAQDIAQSIQVLRGQRVVLDADLAALYGVTTKRLNEQVKRNQERFPSDFLFQLRSDEKAEVVANCDHLKRLKFSPTLPYAFTEHGAIQAANVLASSQAVKMGIYVVRAFVQIRQAAALHADVDKRLRELELKHNSLSNQTQVELRQTRRDLKDVFDTLRELMTPPPTPPKRPIGFITDDAPLVKAKPKALRGKAAKG